MRVSDIVPALLSGEPHANPWKILIERGKKDGEYELIDALDKLTLSEKAGFFKILEFVGKNGPENLPRENRHEIDKKNEIYEFKKGNFRLTWFYDDGKVIVCSHIFRKKSQKTPESEILRSINFKNKYLKAKKDNTLSVDEARL